MSGIGALHMPGFQIQNAEPDGYEHFCIVAFTKRVVHFGKHFGRAHTAACVVLDSGFCAHHEKRGRNALAADVGDHQTKAVNADIEEVVEIAADFFRRGHQCMNIDVFCRKIKILRK